MEKTTTKDQKKFFQRIKDSWPTVRKWLVGFLMKKVFPKLAGGPWGTVISFFIDIIFNKFLKPLWDLTWQKVNSQLRKLRRKPKVKDFEEAKNESDFDDSFDNLP